MTTQEGLSKSSETDGQASESTARDVAMIRLVYADARRRGSDRRELQVASQGRRSSKPDVMKERMSDVVSATKRCLSVYKLGRRKTGAELLRYLQKELLGSELDAECLWVSLLDFVLSMQEMFKDSKFSPEQIKNGGTYLFNYLVDGKPGKLHKLQFNMKLSTMLEDLRILKEASPRDVRIQVAYGMARKIVGLGAEEAWPAITTCVGLAPGVETAALAKELQAILADLQSTADYVTRADFVQSCHRVLEGSKECGFSREEVQQGGARLFNMLVDDINTGHGDKLHKAQFDAKISAVQKESQSLKYRDVDVDAACKLAQTFESLGAGAWSECTRSASLRDAKAAEAADATKVVQQVQGAAACSSHVEGISHSEFAQNLLEACKTYGWSTEQVAQGSKRLFDYMVGDENKLREPQFQKKLPTMLDDMSKLKVASPQDVEIEAAYELAQNLVSLGAQAWSVCARCASRGHESSTLASKRVAQEQKFQAPEQGTNSNEDELLQHFEIGQKDDEEEDAERSPAPVQKVIRQVMNLRRALAAMHSEDAAQDIEGLDTMLADLRGVAKVSTQKHADLTQPALSKERAKALATAMISEALENAPSMEDGLSNLKESKEFLDLMTQINPNIPAELAGDVLAAQFEKIKTMKDPGDGEPKTKAPPPAGWKAGDPWPSAGQYTVAVPAPPSGWKQGDPWPSDMGAPPAGWKAGDPWPAKSSESQGRPYLAKGALLTAAHKEGTEKDATPLKDGPAKPLESQERQSIAEMLMDLIEKYPEDSDKDVARSCFVTEVDGPAMQKHEDPSVAHLLPSSRASPTQQSSPRLSPLPEKSAGVPSMLPSRRQSIIEAQTKQAPAQSLHRFIRLSDKRRGSHKVPQLCYSRRGSISREGASHAHPRVSPRQTPALPTWDPENISEENLRSILTALKPNQVQQMLSELGLGSLYDCLADAARTHPKSGAIWETYAQFVVRTVIGVDGKQLFHTLSQGPLPLPEEEIIVAKEKIENWAVERDAVDNQLFGVMGPPLPPVKPPPSKKRKGRRIIVAQSPLEHSVVAPMPPMWRRLEPPTPSLHSRPLRMNYLRSVL